MEKAIFLDRDGVINKLIAEGDKYRSPRNFQEFSFEDGITRFAKNVSNDGFLLVVITNQPEFKRGLVSKEIVYGFHKRIKKELGINHFYICWHDNEDQCECRKPKPGLIFQAKKELNINLSQSFFVGDRLKDIIAAKAAGVKGLLYSQKHIEGIETFPIFESIYKYVLNYSFDKNI